MDARGDPGHDGFFGSGYFVVMRQAPSRLGITFEDSRNVVDAAIRANYISIVFELSLGTLMKPNQVVAALSALAQETRLKLFRLLVQRGADGLPAGVIAERLDVPPSSLTFHLQQLLHAGLVTQ